MIPGQRFAYNIVEFFITKVTKIYFENNTCGPNKN